MSSHRSFALVVLTITLIMYQHEVLPAQHRTRKQMTLKLEHRDNSDSLKVVHEAGRVSDSVIVDYKMLVDSVMVNIQKSGVLARKTLSSFGDSLMLSQKDSISTFRKDSIRGMSALLGNNIGEYAGTQINVLRRFTHAAEHALMSTARMQVEDVAEARDTLFVLRDIFSDSLLDWSTGANENLLDSLAILRDSLAEYVSLLHDNQEMENDAEQNRLDSLAQEEQRASRFVLGCGYTNRITYKGYDAGQASPAIFPSVKYRHRSGVSASVTAYKLINAAKWDGFEIGGEYEHEFSDRLSGSLSFTHFISRDSSTQIKSSLTNEIGGGMSIDASLVNLEGSAGLSFGKSATDLNLSLGVSRLFEFTNEGASLQVWIQPSFTGFFGTQKVITRGGRAVKAKGKSSTILSVVAYELDVPLILRFGKLDILPSFTLAIPENQPSTVSSKSFGIVSIEVHLTIK